MSADLIRRAAAQMRANAQGYGIPDSPWFTEPSWTGADEACVKAYDPETPGLPYDVADEMEPRLATHIASWHPAVALAVVDHLAHIAGRHYAVETHGIDDAWSNCLVCGVDMDEDTDCPDLASALKVANAYLGRDENCDYRLAAEQ